MTNQDDAKKRLVRGCGFSALVGGLIFVLIFTTVCVVTYILPRHYSSSVVYEAGGAAPNKAGVMGRVVEKLGLEQRWGVTKEIAIETLNDSSYGEDDYDSGRLEFIFTRPDMDEAAELANAWAEAAELRVLEKAEAAPSPSHPDIPLNLAIGALVAVALALPPAGIVLLLTAKAKK